MDNTATCRVKTPEPQPKLIQLRFGNRKMLLTPQDAAAVIGVLADALADPRQGTIECEV